jgi:hypothetical protein
LANFLNISPNQTKYLASVRLVPGLEFFAIPVSISAVSLGRLYQLIYFLDFKVAKWAVSSLTHSSNSLEYCKYIYFNIHDSNIATAQFLVKLLAGK